MKSLLEQVAELAELRQQAAPGPWQQSHRKGAGGYSTQVYNASGETIASFAWQPKPADSLGWIGTYRTENAEFTAAAGNLDFAALHAALAATPAFSSPGGGPKDAGAAEILGRKIAMERWPEYATNPDHGRAVNCFAQGYVAAAGAGVSASGGGPATGEGEQVEAGNLALHKAGLTTLGLLNGYNIRLKTWEQELQARQDDYDIGDKTGLAKHNYNRFLKDYAIAFLQFAREMHGKLAAVVEFAAKMGGTPSVVSKEGEGAGEALAALRQMFGSADLQDALGAAIGLLKNYHAESGARAVEYLCKMVADAVTAPTPEAPPATGAAPEAGKEQSHA